MLDRALASRPDHAGLLQCLAVLRVRQGDPAAAADRFRAALALEPGNAGANANLGKALFALGRVAEAAACYRRTAGRMRRPKRSAAR